MLPSKRTAARHRLIASFQEGELQGSPRKFQEEVSTPVSEYGFHLLLPGRHTEYIHYRSM